MPELPVPDSSMNPLPPAWYVRTQIICYHCYHTVYKVEPPCARYTAAGLLDINPTGQTVPVRTVFPEQNYFRPTCSLTRKCGRSCTRTPCRPKVRAQGLGLEVQSYQVNHNTFVSL